MDNRILRDPKVEVIRRPVPAPFREEGRIFTVLPTVISIDTTARKVEALCYTPDRDLDDFPDLDFVPGFLQPADFDLHIVIES